MAATVYSRVLTNIFITSALTCASPTIRKGNVYSTSYLFTKLARYEI